MMGDEDSNEDSSFSCENELNQIGWCELSDYEHDEHEFDTWVDVKDATTIISFDQATHEAWEAAKLEIKTIRQNMINMLQLDKLNDFCLSALVDFIFGPTSALWKIFNDNLNGSRIYHPKDPLTHEVFKKIIGSFFTASSLGLSSSDLWGEDTIKSSHLCTHEQYLTFWKAITTRDHSSRHDSSTDYLWLKVLDQVNTVCRDLFLRGWEPHQTKFVTIDDDKTHYNGKMGFYNTAGLKPTQLVRDNRKGFVFHTLVFTASGVPLGIEAEMVSDQNSNDASSRLLTRQLCPNHRSNQIPNLINVTIFADRLYWTKEFLFNYILPSNADVGPSTHKRSHNYPFTFDQKLTRNDTRTLISKRGSKCIYLKERRTENHTLSAVAYRDGYGKVALGISSGNNQFRSKHWDFHLSSPADRYKILDNESDWYHSSATWIRNIKFDEKLSQTFLIVLHQTCNVEAVTTEGSEDQSWFLARSFSFTSSTTDKVINIVLDVAAKGGIVGDTLFVNSLNKVLVYQNKNEIQTS